jgi:hypothetical protein
MFVNSKERINDDDQTGGVEKVAAWVASLFVALAAT